MTYDEKGSCGHPDDIQPLEARSSQRDKELFLRLGLDGFTRIFATGLYLRAFNTPNAPLPEDDLFSGLR